MLQTCMNAMLRLCLALTLLGATVHTNPTTQHSNHRQRQSSSPCSDLANAQAAFMADNPMLKVASVPTDLVYECLTSVPVQKNFSVQLVNNVRAWFEFQSDIDYIASPPSGSLWQPINLFAYLDDIADHVQHDRYDNQYDFELDLYTFGLYFHDGHTAVSPGLFLTGLGCFDRNLALISYSTDGIQAPKVYLAEDVLLQTATGFELAAKDTKASPVATINDIPVQEFLQTQALVTPSHDPDAMYNQLFLTIPTTFNPSGQSFTSFQWPAFYPGSETIVKREDETVLTVPVLSRMACDLSQITSGDDFWRKCVFGEEETPASAADGTTTSTATATENKYVRAQSTAEVDPVKTGAVPQLANHPVPERVDIDNMLSGYFLEDHEDVAVLVIRSFDGPSDGFLESFQNTLESFLEHAQDKHKTKLIIDLQGNSGGAIDLSTELIAQLFPNIPPNEKNNMRASLGIQLILEKIGRWLDYINQNATNENMLQNEADIHLWAWQAVMKPDAEAFVSFEDYYGPIDLGKDGNYTRFFQANYTNRDPSELDQEGIQITGYGDRLRAPGTPPPFNASNIIILTDGTCASACTIAVELLLNAHSIPSIVVGGRPSTGPMQTMGNTKGSLSLPKKVLRDFFLGPWLDDEFEPINRTQAASTPFQYLEDFGLRYGVENLNGRNNYRIGDDTETPLQMVYSAADCKMWPTLEMLTDQSRVWSRVADIAFDPARKAFGAEGGPYTSEFCVEDSTGHSTSATGGLKYGQLGNQNPPRSAYSQYSGWLKGGKEIVQGLSLVRIDDDDSGTTAAAGSSLPSDGQVKVGISEMKTACDGYSGNKWMITLLCRIFG